MVHKNPDGENKPLFEGFAHFMHGEIHGGPAIIYDPNGVIRIFTYMKHGRSEGLMKLYLPEKQKAKILSTKNTDDAGGYCYFYGNAVDSTPFGWAKSFNLQGSIFQGEWLDGLKVKGVLSEL